MHIVERVQLVASEIVVVVHDKKQTNSLPDLKTCSCVEKIRFAFDAYSTRSALVGIHGALKAAKEKYAAVIACDMPHVSAELLQAEHAALLNSGKDAAVPRTSFGYEHFHGVYNAKQCADVAAALIENNQHRVSALFEQINVKEFTKEDMVHISRSAGCFKNINTPQDFSELQKFN